MKVYSAYYSVLFNNKILTFFQGLPSSHFLDFESGIKAKLSFEHVCSNLCDLVLHVEDTGSASECDVSLFEVSKVSMVLLF